MSISFNCANINFDFLLTNKQKNIFFTLPNNLKDIITNKLSGSEDPQSIETARLILDIMRYEIDRDLQDIRDIFFENLLKKMSDEINNYLEKLLSIVKKNMAVIFFKCVSSPKEQYYSEITLLSIIDAFYEVSKSINLPYPTPSYFPDYEHGGKELLSQIVINPGSIVNLLTQKQAIDSYETQIKPASYANLNNLLNSPLNFKDLKSGAISYLASLSEKNRLTMEIYLSFFKFLENDVTNSKLGLEVKCKIIHLVLLTTSHESKSDVMKYSLNDLKGMLNESRIIQEQEGDELILNFSKAPDLNNHPSLDLVIRVLKMINTLSTDINSLDMMYSNIEDFSIGKITLNQLLEELTCLVVEHELNAIKDGGDLELLLKRFAGNDPNVQFPLDHHALETIKNQYLIIHNYCIEGKDLRTSTLISRVAKIKSKSPLNSLEGPDVLELIAIGRLAIRNEFHVYLYNTQILTVLGLLLYNKGCIAQVNTGEGKSFIVTLLAFVLAMYGGQVHIISSADSLAKRDQVYCQKFFKLFGFLTSHICDNRFSDASYFQGSILYPTFRKLLSRSAIFL